MSNTLAFTFENTSLTILGDILNPLFIAHQVCSILGFTNTSKAVKDHCDSEDVCKLEMTDRLGRKQEVNCVNESGLYALIFGSKLPKAKQFKRWVTNEVLPAIRKQGCYSAQGQDNALIIKEPTKPLTPAQQQAIQYEVARRAEKRREDYRKIYFALKMRFKVGTYKDILQSDFEEAVKFIRSVPVVSTQEPDQKHQACIPSTTAEVVRNASIDETGVRLTLEQWWFVTKSLQKADAMYQYIRLQTKMVIAYQEMMIDIDDAKSYGPLRNDLAHMLGASGLSLDVPEIK